MNDKIKIEKIHPKAQIPFNKLGDAGHDLYAIESAIINPGERRLIRTGIKLEIPIGFYGRIAPRSGLALKHGIDVMAGVIDSTYRGEIGVILYNSSIIGSNLVHTEHSTYLFADNNSFSIKEGDRIAQIIFERYYNFDFVEGKLSETERKEGGFGSTGK